MSDETISIEGSRVITGELWLRSWVEELPVGYKRQERWLHPAMLPTVVGSRALRDISGNERARHIGHWQNYTCHGPTPRRNQTETP